MRLRRFLSEKLMRVALLSGEVLAIRKGLESSLAGRDASELLDNEYFAEIVLGGLRVDDWRRPRYPPNSLSGFYHDLLGIGVDNLKLLLARLSDGLSLRLATRGIRVVAEETEPLRLISIIRSLSERILSKIGHRVAETMPSREPSDQHAAIEALNELLDAIMETLPPYSREAQLLFAAGNASFPRKLYEELPRDEQEELRELGLQDEQQLPGCPDDPAKCFLRARSDSAIQLYSCYAKASIRLLQNRQVRNYYNVPDPLEDLVKTLREESLSDNLLQELAQYARKTPCLPKDHCPAPPPCLPTGYLIAEISLPLRDVIVELPAEREATISEILEKIYPQLCKGLARIYVTDNNHIGLLFVAKPPGQTAFLQEAH